ncbi:MAG: hypothetical protein H0W21_01645 [Actinobacteria bacterium]|nr:hypothetical protein [Actinomycetota bacterium]
MAGLRPGGRRPGRDAIHVPGTRLEALHAVSGTGTPVRSNAVVREIGRSMALLGVTGSSVGGGLSMVVVAIHALGR